MEQLQLIQSKIYEIRGQKVMSDFDLGDFMFQLSADEWQILKSQFVTSSWGGVRKLPFAFNE